MDPFSAEGELLNVQNTFYAGDYTTVLDFDTSSLSTSNKLPARILQLRAQIANGGAKDVLTALKKEGSDPELAAVKAFAQYELKQTAEAVKAIEALAAGQADNATVQLLGGIVLQGSDKSEEALALLSKHQGSLEAVALIVQIHLIQNRTDLALKEVQAARKWAQDSLLVNIAESWVGLRVGGDRYQSAYYVFEEMAQAPGSTSGTKSLVSQAVAEIHLGRMPEAEAALDQALSRNPEDIEAIANSVVLGVISGKNTDEKTAMLRQKAPECAMLQDIAEKGKAFDVAASKYAAKVSS